MTHYTLVRPHDDCPDDWVAQLAERVGLEIKHKTSLRQFPGSQHWHLVKPGETGTLEVTDWPQKEKRWISIQDGRKAKWIDLVLAELGLQTSASTDSGAARSAPNLAIFQLEPADRDRFALELAKLLHQAIEDGFSLEFLGGTPMGELIQYWHSVFDDLSENRLLWVGLLDEQVVGTAQLNRCTKANGRQRGEVLKVITHSEFRGQGIARTLLETLETTAKSLGLRLLVLDTEREAPSALAYTKLGWTRVGDIPEYALNVHGELIATTYFYKLIDPN